jgi:hypothetical protein
VPPAIVVCPNAGGVPQEVGIHHGKLEYTTEIGIHHGSWNTPR